MQHHIVRPRRQLLLAPLCALALSAGLVAPGHAHGPTRQKVVEKVTIDAPAAGTPMVCTTRMPARTRLLARSVAPVKSSAMQPSLSVMCAF